MLAVQTDGSDVVTIEGLDATGEIADLQAAFVERNALQCGFCTPGMLMAAAELVRAGARKTRAEIRTYLAGNFAAAPAITPSSTPSPRRSTSAPTEAATVSEPARPSPARRQQ